MKRKFNFVLAGLIIPVLALSSACQKQKAGWQGTIEEENGIRVVNNPAEPYYGEFIIDLEEDLAIGSEEDDNYMFYRAYYLNVDNQGNIYVADSGNHRIQKYDKDGNYVQTIGRKGQGPGEFDMPFHIFIDEHDNIHVSELRKMHIFDSKGNSIKSVVLPTYIGGFAADYEGNIIANAFIRAEGGQNFGIVLIDPEGKMTRTIIEYSGVRRVARKGTMFSFSHSYTPQLSFSPIGQKEVVYGYGSEYKLFVTDFFGETSLIIKKDEPSQSISRQEKDKIINDTIENTAQEGREWPKDVVEEGANFPDHRPFFNHISSDDKGRIFVSKIKSVLDESKKAEVDIFSPDGYFLYTTKLSFTPELIKNGYLYDIWTSEETGEVRIKRYKIKNWDQIKVSK